MQTFMTAVKDFSLPVVAQPLKYDVFYHGIYK